MGNWETLNETGFSHVLTQVAADHKVIHIALNWFVFKYSRSN